MKTNGCWLVWEGITVSKNADLVHRSPFQALGQSLHMAAGLAFKLHFHRDSEDGKMALSWRQCNFLIWDGTEYSRKGTNNIKNRIRLKEVEIMNMKQCVSPSFYSQTRWCVPLKITLTNCLSNYWMRLSRIWRIWKPRRVLSLISAHQI